MARRIKLLLGVFALATLAVAAGAGCLHHGPPDPARLERRVTAIVDDVLDDLDATDAQRARIDAIRTRLMASARETFAGTREELQREVLGQLAAPAPDAAKLHALVDARVEAQRRFGHQAVDAFVEAHGVLTPEQRAELEQKLRRHVDER